MFEKHFKILFIFMVMSIFAAHSHAENWQNVRVVNDQLQEDFDHDSVYKPFFVKGVAYHPLPIGRFDRFPSNPNDWSGNCKYIGNITDDSTDQLFVPAPADPPQFDCSKLLEYYLNDDAILNRDFMLIKAMNANTIRTLAKATPNLLKYANQNGLKVIAGYWIDHNIDFTFPDDKNAAGLPISGSGQARKQALIDDFVSYVTYLKNSPDASAILMWGLSNESNLDFCNACVFAGKSCNRADQVSGFYNLVNTMALRAKSAEGDFYHPTAIVFADLSDASSNLFSELKNYASLIPDIKMIGINSYRGQNFNVWPTPQSGQPRNLFEQFQNVFPNKEKGVIVTEFGVDAWHTNSTQNDSGDGYEDQLSQAMWVTSAWDEIQNNSVSNNGPSNGGVVFAYSDRYDDYVKRPADAEQCDYVSSNWTPSVASHDYGLTEKTGGMPDGAVNPEWWGIMSPSKSRYANGIDDMNPRSVYAALQKEFGPHCWISTGPIVRLKVEERFSVVMKCNVYTERVKFNTGFNNAPIPQTLIDGHTVPLSNDFFQRPAGTTGDWVVGDGQGWKNLRLIKSPTSSVDLVFRGESGQGANLLVEPDQKYSIQGAYRPVFLVKKGSSSIWSNHGIIHLGETLQYKITNGIPKRTSDLGSPNYDPNCDASCNSIDPRIWIRVKAPRTKHSRNQGWGSWQLLPTATGQALTTDKNGEAISPALSTQGYQLGVYRLQIKMESQPNKFEVLSNVVTGVLRN